MPAQAPPLVWSTVLLTVYGVAALADAVPSAMVTSRAKPDPVHFKVPLTFRGANRVTPVDLEKLPARLQDVCPENAPIPFEAMADIGSTLREARMRARIDITEVETRTKIRAKYLRAIENEEWDLLPGPIYVKSFLRTYGDFLGLDSRLLIDEYKRRYERPSDHEMRPISALTHERERAARGPLLPPWAIIGVVLVAVVVVLYLIGTAGNNNKKPTTPTGVHAGTTKHKKRKKHHKTTPAATTVKLELVPTGSVYVCLVDGTGKKLIPGQIFSSGQRIPTETASKLLLTLGNASVQMKVNGSSVKVSPSSSSIGFLLEPTSHKALPVSQQPRCA